MLKSLFDTLSVPTSYTKDNYETTKIFDSNHRLGKNFKGEPSILFKTNKNNFKNTDYLGKYIHLRFDIECNLKEGDKDINENYTIISCLAEDEQSKKIFLEVCETTYLEIGSEPSNSKIYDLTHSIIELFKGWSANKTDFLGLWGELFMIVSSDDQIKCLKAWHNHNNDKYDFYDDNSALEVKCTTKGERKHEFRHHQLMSNLSNHYIASILTKENYSKGLSVNDLFQKIMENKLDNLLIDKLKKVFFSIVQNIPESIINNYRYDYDFAKRNLMYFSVPEINTLENHDQSISNIKYTMDLSQKQNVDELGKDKFTSYLHFPS